MNTDDIISPIANELRSMPWMQQLLALLQKQTEEIAALKKPCKSKEMRLIALIT